MKKTVSVDNSGDFDKMLRKFKKKVNNSGKLQSVRDKQEYVKPSEKRKTARAKARQRWLKSEKCTHSPNYK